MARLNYYEQLKHPKWQEKRLRIMERAGFACEWCESAEATLHVHHTLYRRGAKVWEYEDDELLCLCEECHAIAEQMLATLRGMIGRLGRRKHGRDLRQLIGYARALTVQNDIEDEPRASYFELDHRAEMTGLRDFFGISLSEMLDYFGADPSGADGGVVYGASYYELEAMDPRPSWTVGGE